MPHTAGILFGFLRRRTLSLAQERRFSGVLPAFSLTDRYAVKILSPILHCVLIFLRKI